MNILITICIVLAVLALAFWLFQKVTEYRRIVPVNQVHIVRRGAATLVYGAGKNTSGNVYYAWPEWLPLIGVKVSTITLSIFDIKLNDYLCYDKNRLPFLSDIQAYFKISDYQKAAERIRDAETLNAQLRGVLQGAVRHLLANEELENILGGYAEYGVKFTNAVTNSLAGWGITTAQTIELMDIKDVQGEKIIYNIQQKRKSEIEKESREAIAENNRLARIKEIDSLKAIRLKEQEMEESVGTRTAEAEARIGVEKERASQRIHDEARTTSEKKMAVMEVEKTRQAEIEKKSRVIASEGDLQATENESAGIRAKGEAQAKAEEDYQMASVNAQIALAQEIGQNPEYQEYLIAKHQIDAAKVVGIKQAENLGKADIHILANGGDVSTASMNAGSIFSPKGGLGIAGMLEALSASDKGKTFLSSINRFLAKNGGSQKTEEGILEALNSSEEGKALLASVQEFLAKKS